MLLYELYHKLVAQNKSVDVFVFARGLFIP